MSLCQLIKYRLKVTYSSNIRWYILDLIIKVIDIYSHLKTIKCSLSFLRVSLKISFKRDKNIGNLSVRNAFQPSNQPGTCKWARAWCKTCPFICNVEKLSGPKRFFKITDHFPCTSANAMYCITCTLCKKIYIGEKGRRLGDRFREHLRDVEEDDTNASKPVARHFNLPILSNIWQSAAPPYIKEARKAAKL